MDGKAGPFRSAYDIGNKLLNTYVFSNDSSTADKPNFTKAMRWNIFIYITAVCCYKFGLESYNGSVRSLAIDRFTADGFPVYQNTGYLDGFQAAAQCLGCIFVGPLIRYFHIRTVLAGAVAVWALIASLVMIIENATGGTFPTKCVSENGLPPKCTGAIRGDWSPLGIIPIFVISGIPFGVVEMIRRIIPQHIVGGDVMLLKKMDALVHMCFEISGTCGSFFASYISLVNGKAYAAIITPPLYAIAGIVFMRIIPVDSASKDSMQSDVGYGQISTANDVSTTFLGSVGSAFMMFGLSVYEGAKIVLLERRFTWLIFAYTLPLVMHRYIESGVVSIYAKLVLGESAYGPFINGGSNCGEFLGAAFVFFNLRNITTPIPTLRWDAIMLNLTWLYYNAVRPDSVNTSVGNTAAIMALVMCVISSGWSAGDVSVAAFIQSNIPTLKVNKTVTPPLAAVMSFLYVLNIVIFAIISPVIGRWVDQFAIDAKMTTNKAEKAAFLQDQKDQYFYWIAGVFFSLMSIIIFTATFLPRGSWTCNPEVLHDYDADDENSDAPSGQSVLPANKQDLTLVPKA